MRFVQLVPAFVQRTRALRTGALLLAAASVTAGCAPTEVQTTFERNAPMPRPERILVYDFATSPSDVQSNVQVYATTQQGLERLEEFTTDARSGYKPGAAETMGAGAAAGNLAAAAAVSAGAGVLSETLSADVDADAKRTADRVAQQLQQYFAQQGWIAPQ